MPAAKLLLVEDDPALSELLEYRFQNEGYDVRCTGDGDEALVLATVQELQRADDELLFNFKFHRAKWFQGLRSVNWERSAVLSRDGFMFTI